MLADNEITWTYQNYNWNNEPLPPGWSRKTDLIHSGQYYERKPTKMSDRILKQSHHPYLYTNVVELNRLGVKELLKIKPWQIDWHMQKIDRISTKYPQPIKIKIINILIEWASLANRAIIENKIGKITKLRKLNEKYSNDISHAYTSSILDDLPPVPTTRPKIGGKWTTKYKKKINCSHPKGFSQKQYCKYGRKTRKNRRSK